VSKWPETYCYTVSDAVRNGVYPVALDIGAFAERMEMHNYGATIPFTDNTELLYESILGGCQIRNVFTRIFSNKVGFKRSSS